MSRALAAAASFVTLTLALALLVGLWGIGVEVRDLETGVLAGELQLALSRAASAHPVDFHRLGELGKRLAAGERGDLESRLAAALPDYSGLAHEVASAFAENHPGLAVAARVQVTRVALLGGHDVAGVPPLLIAGPAALPAGAVTARHSLFLDAGGMAVEVLFQAVCTNVDEELGPRLRPLRVGSLLLALLVVASSIVTLRAVVYGRTVGAHQRDLIDTLAHELHTPLTTLHVGLSTLARDRGASDRDVIERLDRQVRRLRRLTERVTVTSRALLHDAVPDLAILRPDEEIARLLAERFPEELAAGALATELDATAARVLADPADFEVLIGNLVENALKFSAAGRSDAEAGPRVLVTTGVRRRRVAVTVEDAGAGIDRGQARRMASPFRHGGQPASGLGLGLYLCRRIVKRMRGRLVIRTSELGGACVEVTVPLDGRRSG